MAVRRVPQNKRALYIRPRKPKETAVVCAPADIASGGHWFISSHICKKCGNHKRVHGTRAVIACSYIKCEDYRE